MSAIDEKKKGKRIRILEAAYKLFVEKSIQSTAIDEVVNVAGVAKGTFYLYFKDKYDLLDQIIVHKSADMLKQLWGKMQAMQETVSMTGGERFMFFMNELIAYMEQHKDVLTLISKNLSMCIKAIFAIDDEDLSDIVGELHQVFAEKGRSATDAEKTFYLIANMVISVCHDAIINQQPYPMAEMKPVLLAAVQTILLSPPPAVYMERNDCLC